MQSGHLIVRHKSTVLLQVDILEDIFKCFKGPLQHSYTAEARQRHKETVTIFFGEREEREETARITEFTLTLLLKEFTIGNEIGGGCTNIAIHVPNGGKISLDSDLQGSSEVEKERCEIWQKFARALDVPQVRVSYAAHVAKIINTPYKSDLDPWLRPDAGTSLGPRRRHDSLIKHVHRGVFRETSGKDSVFRRKISGLDDALISGDVVLLVINWTQFLCFNVFRYVFISDFTDPMHSNSSPVLCWILRKHASMGDPRQPQPRFVATSGARLRDLRWQGRQGWRYRRNFALN